MAAMAPMKQYVGAKRLSKSSKRAVTPLAHYRQPKRKPATR